MTAPPRRREVTNPARTGPEFSTARTLSTNSLPRREIPPDLTRSNSDGCVSRRDFGNEKEVAADIRRVFTPRPYNRSLLPNAREKTSQEEATPEDLRTRRCRGWRFSRSWCNRRIGARQFFRTGSCVASNVIAHWAAAPPTPRAARRLQGQTPLQWRLVLQCMRFRYGLAR